MADQHNCSRTSIRTDSLTVNNIIKLLLTESNECNSAWFKTFLLPIWVLYHPAGVNIAIIIGCTVTAEIIGTPRTLQNTTFPPETISNYKCLGIHMFFFPFMCIGTTHTKIKNWEKNLWLFVYTNLALSSFWLMVCIFCYGLYISDLKVLLDLIFFFFLLKVHCINITLA